MSSPDPWDFEQYRAILHARASELNMQIGVREDPSDIVQDTILNAWANKEEFRGKDSSQKIAWLFTIQNNIFISKLRQHHAGRRDLNREVIQQKLDESTQLWIEKIEAQKSSPEAAAEEREEQALLDTALSQLPEREREVMFLHLKEKLSTAQIAERMNTTKGTVAGLISRATARLARILKPE